VAKHLIVTADDFGLTDGVSRGILEAHRRGILTATSALVNLSDLMRHRELADAAPTLGIGLHLNVTLGAPVLSADRVRSLVGQDGKFVRDGGWRAAAGDPGELRAEIAAQAGRFVTFFGRRPTHLDTHHHTHLYPPILEAILDQASTMRIPVRAVSRAMAAEIRRRGVSCPDRLVGDVGVEAYWTRDRLLALIPTLPDGVTELMCHPGYADAALAASSYCAQREVELAAFCDPAVREALHRAGVRLISQSRLAEATRP
jgi:predicted glycoside hydrolase/deacetylase ChbG (UPF0249 family)